MCILGALCIVVHVIVKCPVLLQCIPYVSPFVYTSTLLLISYAVNAVVPLLAWAFAMTGRYARWISFCIWNICGCCTAVHSCNSV